MAARLARAAPLWPPGQPSRAADLRNRRAARARSVPAMTAERDDLQSGDRYARGRAHLSRLHATTGEAIVDDLGDLGRHIVEYAFGDVYARPGLELRDRQLITVAMLAALGNLPQLEVHLKAALRVGITVDELVEVALQVAPYAGFPRAMDAMRLIQALEPISD